MIVYSPKKYFIMTKKGSKLGVVGLGGLGHTASITNQKELSMVVVLYRIGLAYETL